jgi:hypothetical protein
MFRIWLPSSAPLRGKPIDLTITSECSNNFRLVLIFSDLVCLRPHDSWIYQDTIANALGTDLIAASVIISRLSRSESRSTKKETQCTYYTRLSFSPLFLRAH